MFGLDEGKLLKSRPGKYDYRALSQSVDELEKQTSELLGYARKPAKSPSPKPILPMREPEQRLAKPEDVEPDEPIRPDKPFKLDEPAKQVSTPLTHERNLPNSTSPGVKNFDIIVPKKRLEDRPISSFLEAIEKSAEESKQKNADQEEASPAISHQATKLKPMNDIIRPSGLDKSDHPVAKTEPAEEPTELDEPAAKAEDEAEPNQSTTEQPIKASEERVENTQETLSKTKHQDSDELPPTPVPVEEKVTYGNTIMDRLPSREVEEKQLSEDDKKPAVNVFDTEEYHQPLHDWSQLERHSPWPIILIASGLVVAGLLAWFVLTRI